MRFPHLIGAKFVKRLNRFVCSVLIRGKEFPAYIRNTGRLSELLKKGSSVYVKHKSRGKYNYELVLAEYGDGILVCLDAQIAPKLYAEAVYTGSILYEPKIGNSRFDILVGRELIEVKSVNLVRGGVALFPDAPTQRGVKHIELLMRLYPEYIPKLIFVIQREDARVFSPNKDTDPTFAEKLRLFASKGHKIKAYTCTVSLEEIKLKEEIEVMI